MKQIMMAAILVLPRLVAAVDDCGESEASELASLNAPQPEPLPALGRTFDRSGELAEFTVFGTWNAIRAMTAMIQQYENAQQQHVVSFTPYDSNQILARLSRRECDVGVPFDSFVPDADRNSAGRFESFPIARFVVAVIVNAKSPARNITTEELRHIFTWDLMNGRNISSWKDVRGSRSAARIEIFRPDTFSPASLVFRKAVGIDGPFLDEFFDPVVHPRRERPTDAAVVEEVINQANAIGFVVYRYEENMDKRIQILGIAPTENVRPVIPSPSTVADGSYPLVDAVTLYLHPEAPAEAREFCKFAAGPDGANILKQFGLWPEHDLEDSRLEQNLAEVKKGGGTLITVFDLTGSAPLLNDLGLDFMKAKSAVRLSLLKSASQDEAVVDFVKGTSDLLLVDRPPASGSWELADMRRKLTPGAPSARQRLEEDQAHVARDDSTVNKPITFQSPLPVASNLSSGKNGSEGEEKTGQTSLNDSLSHKPLAASMSSSAFHVTTDKEMGGESPQDGEQTTLPHAVVLGRIAVGVIVHPENPLESLTVDEARAIFGGHTKKWPAVRGAAPAMHVFGLKHTDPITQLLKEKLAGLTRLSFNAQPDNEKVILAVATDPAAIGFVDLSRLSPEEKSVKPVPVLLPGQSLPGPAPPTKEKGSPQGKKGNTAGKGQGASRPHPGSLQEENDAASAGLEIPNPLSRTLTLYVSPSASQTAKEFADFLTSERCKETLARHNLLPPLQTGTARLASGPHPDSLRVGEGTMDLASTEEPLPLVLHEPRALPDPARVESKTDRKSEVPTSNRPAPPKLAADAPTVPAAPGAAGTPALSDKEKKWVIGGVAGLVLLAIGVGWLQAPHRKRKRR